MKIKLRNFDTKINPDEKIQDVKYYYSIADSTGLLGIDLTIPDDADPVEQFILHIKNLYKDFSQYEILHNKWKYKYTSHKTVNGVEWFILKTKMW